MVVVGHQIKRNECIKSSWLVSVGGQWPRDCFRKTSPYKNATSLEMDDNLMVIVLLSDQHQAHHVEF